MSTQKTKKVTAPETPKTAAGKAPRAFIEWWLQHGDHEGDNKAIEQAAFEAGVASCEIWRQDLALQNSRIRRLYALLDQITNRCRFSLQIRDTADNRREDIAWIQNQIQDQTFTIGRGSAQ